MLVDYCGLFQELSCPHEDWLMLFHCIGNPSRELTIIPVKIQFRSLFPKALFQDVHGWTLVVKVPRFVSTAVKLSQKLVPQLIGAVSKCSRRPCTKRASSSGYHYSFPGSLGPWRGLGISFQFCGTTSAWGGAMTRITHSSFLH